MGDQDVITLRLLGRWDAAVRGRSVPVGLRQQRLLAALAVHGPRSRHFLGGLLWPEGTESHALGSLRAAVFTLSRRLPGAVVCRGADLALGEAVDVDLHHLLDVLARPVASWLPEREDRWLLDRSGVELLPGWYDDWVLDEQERVRALYVNGVEERAEFCLAHGEVRRALALARTVQALDPLRESTALLVIRGQLAMGNEAAARRTFDRLRAAMAQELGAAPSAQVSALVHTARQGASQYPPRATLK